MRTQILKVQQPEESFKFFTITINKQIFNDKQKFNTSRHVIYDSILQLPQLPQLQQLPQISSIAQLFELCLSKTIKDISIFNSMHNGYFNNSSNKFTLHNLVTFYDLFKLTKIYNCNIIIKDKISKQILVEFNHIPTNSTNQSTGDIQTNITQNINLLLDGLDLSLETIDIKETTKSSDLVGGNYKIKNIKYKLEKK